ncbi:hypothetical protein BO82DRAFT_363258 [Aspergillus uvarum CBS 121591]|uniref:Uncharacterized protein n=1 Tax=Aspergillus uvarum CBS 121591 TaxID=1448315 RepID=A0A319CEN4_9EURO|nr:hypothetical protein BO82DRAFT_363258 [Aspergillus uvarum CBS 121591]PYH83694.1 hypothetical protein BO82DRAFT_363258 [Aspergillus uvarum CBS 121591]
MQQTTHSPWTRESGKRCNDQHGSVEPTSLNYIEVTRQLPSVNRTLTGGPGAKRADNDGLQAVDHGGQEQEPAYLAYVNCQAPRWEFMNLWTFGHGPPPCWIGLTNMSQFSNRASPEHVVNCHLNREPEHILAKNGEEIDPGLQLGNGCTQCRMN